MSESIDVFGLLLGVRPASMPLPGSEVGAFDAGSTNTPRVGIFDGSKVLGSLICFRQWSLMICTPDDDCACSCAGATHPKVKQTTIAKRNLIDAGERNVSIEVGSSAKIFRYYTTAERIGDSKKSRGFPEDFTTKSRTSGHTSLVEQCSGTLPPEVLQPRRPGTGQFLSRFATLQSLERV